MRASTSDDIGSVQIIEADDLGGFTCMWEHSVCTESVTHRIQLCQDKDSGESDALVMCPRHYVLWLADYTEIHLKECAGSVSEHLPTYGPISGRRSS